jgi:hypothetical protein
MQELIKQLRKDVARGARNVDKARQALALLESLELNEGDLPPIPPPPAPTPTAPDPDPGPGWRLLKVGELISKDAQYTCDDGETWERTSITGRDVDASLVYRTPVYHNPANLETAGEGYRFCLVGETEKDASHWWDCSQSYWRTDFLRNSMASFECGNTYRTNKPLPTT